MNDNLLAEMSNPVLHWMGLIVLAGIMMVAGIYHFTNAKFFVKIVPPLLPYPLFIVYLTGVMEILLGIGLMIPQSRQITAWVLVVYLIAVFPANVYHLTSGGAGTDVPIWVLWLRLPLQVVLIVWAWLFTRAWPP